MFRNEKGRVFVNCFRALVDVMFSVYHTQMACLILVAAEQKLAFKTVTAIVLLIAIVGHNCCGLFLMKTYRLWF